MGYNQHSIVFRTGAVTALETVMSAMLELKKSVRFIFNQEGITVNESVCSNQILIMGMFSAGAFHEYKTTGQGVLCFNEEEAGLLKETFSKNTQRDEVRLSYNHKLKKQKVTVEILQDCEASTGVETRYEIPIVDGDRDIFELQEGEDMTYGVAVNSKHFYHYIEYLKKTEGDYTDSWVSLLVMDDRFEMEKLDDSVPVSKARLVLSTANLPDNQRSKRIVREGTIKQEVSVTHLCRLMKLFSIAVKGDRDREGERDIWIYMSQNKPVTFELQVGSLGTISAAVTTR